MHEISLVRNIFRTLEEEFPESDRAKITSIRLKVGLLSNVEPVLLQNAYGAVIATDQPTFKDVPLEVEMVPIAVQCPVCNAVSEVQNYHFKCNNCDRPTNNVIRGTELMISGVEMA